MAPKPTPEDPQWRPWSGRSVVTQSGRLFGLLGLIAIVAMFLAAAAVALQARRDEARQSDTLLIITSAPPSLALVDHSVELLRRGYAPQALLAGPGSDSLQTALLARGVPEAALALAPANSPGAQHLADAIDVARQNGAESLLVVSEPGELLLGLKVAHDNGVRAYGSAVPVAGPYLLAVLQGAADYWQYVLLGE